MASPTVIRTVAVVRQPAIPDSMPADPAEGSKQTYSTLDATTSMVAGGFFTPFPDARADDAT